MQAVLTLSGTPTWYLDSLALFPPVLIQGMLDHFSPDHQWKEPPLHRFYLGGGSFSAVTVAWQWHGSVCCCGRSVSGTVALLG